MKEHWELAEQKLLLAPHARYTWSPPWPAVVRGVRVSTPVVFEEVRMVPFVVAVMAPLSRLFFPDVEELPRGAVSEWMTEKEHILRVGGAFEVKLFGAPKEPGAHTIELLMEPVELAARRVSERARARRRKRDKQLHQCFETLSSPLPSKSDDDPPLVWTSRVKK